MTSTEALPLWPEAMWLAKKARDHLPIYKLDLADPIFEVPEL